MIPGTADYADHYQNNTIGVRTITLYTDYDEQAETGTPIDLTGATITMNLVNGKDRIVKTIGDGLTVSDASGGQMQVDPFKLDKPGFWDFDIYIEFASADKTYIKGKIKIDPEV